MTKPTRTFGTLLESFFTQRLMKQRNASPHTICSYRDTFRMLLMNSLSSASAQVSIMLWTLPKSMHAANS